VVRYQVSPLFTTVLHRTVPYIDDPVNVSSVYPPRKTSDRAEVKKKEQKQGGQPGKRECREVGENNLTSGGHVVTVRWSGRHGTVVKSWRTVRSYGTVVRSSTYDTHVRYGRQVVKVNTI
jgi:hypothetical protein